MKAGVAIMALALAIAALALGPGLILRAWQEHQEGYHVQEAAG